MSAARCRHGISDAICRLATGGGYATRQLYTDADEVLFDVTRPVILNGIDDVVTRPDLAQRSLFEKLEPIPEDKRKTEDEILTAFEAKRPVILGALLDGIATGLRREASIKPRNYPRMADFALWGTACETAAWPENTFGPAYAANIEEAIDAVLDADIIATAVCTMMAQMLKRPSCFSSWKPTRFPKP
jgi:hypothetical protein